jgi:hypothetical protein
MSDLTIERHHVVAFGRNLMMAPQGKRFRLEACVDADMNFTEPGEYFTDEQLGVSNPAPIADRFGDSPSKTVGRVRRGAFFGPEEDGNFLDNVDKARQLVDPANPIVEAMRMGVKRRRDDVILAGLVAASREGNTLETTTAFPAGQVVAVGGIGLTIAKLRSAAALLDNGETDDGGDDAVGRFWVGGVTDKMSLLATTEVTSQDYNTVKALVDGKIDTFMGFQFKWFPDARIPRNGVNRRNICWTKPSAVYRARPIVGGENANIWQRPDKKGAWYAYLSFDHAFMRRFDAGVVAVDCA